MNTALAESSAIDRICAGIAERGLVVEPDFLPAAAMFLTVLSFNLVGDALRALTDPRQGAL